MRRRAQRAANGGVTGGIGVYEALRKPPRPPTKGEPSRFAEQSGGEVLQEAGACICGRYCRTLGEGSKNRAPRLSTCLIPFADGKTPRRMGYCSPHTLGALSAPLTPSAHFLLPSHSGARGKRPPFGGHGQRRAQSRCAALRGAARLPVSGFAADTGNSPNCRRAPLAFPCCFSSPC